LIHFVTGCKVAQAHRLGRPLDIRPTLEQFRARQRDVMALLLDAERRHAFQLLDPATPLCGTGRCAVARAGHALYFDEHHLSNRGAETLRPMLETAFH
jgi:hypothetical protein